ncbi:MAG: membrane protein insertase YidC [Planctomycetaceae bacterium]
MSQTPDPRRQFLTFVLMMGFFLLWINLAQRMFPNMFGKGEPPAAPAVIAEPDPQNVEPGQAGAAPLADSDKSPAEKPPELQEFPATTILLGDSKAGDLQQLQLTSSGAAIDWQELTEPEFKTLDRQAQLKLLGKSSDGQLRTFAIESPVFDIPLKAYGKSLSTVDWELVPAESELIAGQQAYRRATFRYPSPDGEWEARKTFSLNSGEGIDPTENPQGYLLDVTLTFQHLGDEAASLTYDLQGPVGLPLENVDNTRAFRTAKAGTLEGTNEDSVSFVSQSAGSLAKDIQAAIDNNEPGKRPVWRYPVKWAGIDVQYFAALLIPASGQLTDADRDGEADAYFSEVVPTILQKAEQIERSDISLVFKSRKLSVPAGADQSIEHKFQLYAGPKRVQLLEPFLAQKVMDFGWFAPISKLMVALLSFFHHSLMLPYGLAIILLTVIVRGSMFPISKKQVANIQKMKDLNPKLQEIRTKYANDKEAQGRAQLELMRKHGYNPLAGCLPMFLQLPIFIGLYNGLNAAIDLRLAKFLWVNNLAAPDALCSLPGKLPIVGWTEFNLLPLITIVLFIIQNKLFTPPPTNEEQAMQQKMMNFMMAFMGFLFYRVPAGLCVYFIASSLWGICERKLLDRHKKALEAAGQSGSGGSGGTTILITKPDDDPAKTPGFLAKLLDAADQARHATNGQSTSTSRSDRPGKKSRR